MAKPLALVTGPSSGVGQALAARLTADPYDLIAVSRGDNRITRPDSPRAIPCTPSPAPVVHLLHGLPGQVRRSALALSGSRAEEVVCGDPQGVGVRKVWVGCHHPIEE